MRISENTETSLTMYSPLKTGHAAWPDWVNHHKTLTLALSQEREKGLEESSQGWKAEMSVLKSAPAFHSPSHSYSL